MSTSVEPPRADNPSMSSTSREPKHVKRFRAFHEREVQAAWLYRELSSVAADEGDQETADLLERLAEMEDRHAGHWEELLLQSGLVDVTDVKIPLREKALLQIAKRFGVDTVVPMLMKLEAGDAGMYVGVPEAPEGMASEEIDIGQALANLGDGDVSTIALREDRHRTGSGGALRAATFGVNDGLVSNLALVMGIAGGTADSAIVLLAGIAGLIAGALSMAAGEWISVQSQRELYEREIEVEREELRQFPEQEAEELLLIFQAKGLPEAQAQRLVERIMQDEDVALDTLAREELGLDPDELGSPWVAAIASFFSFAVGATIPVAPFFFAVGSGAVLASSIAAAFALAAVGWTISLLTGRAGWYSALRMVLIGGAAAAATYGIGSLVGIAVG